MLFLIPDTTDPAINLATEEILLTRTDREYILLYFNSPCIIVGKHQVANREADTAWLYLNKIPLYRRLSGGGTVFHDTGNLNFCFISNSEQGHLVDFSRYLSPVIKFLKQSGINAVAGGRNDILADGRKISGNAEHVFRTRVLHHGTLLFSTDLDKLRAGLRSDMSRYITRAVVSNPSPVVNISSLNKVYSDARSFRTGLMDFFTGSIPDAEIILPGHELTQSAEELANLKYRTREWNYDYGPDYIFHGVRGAAEVKLDVHRGLIKDCMVRGVPGIGNPESILKGIRHAPADIFKILSQDNPGFAERGIDYFF